MSVCFFPSLCEFYGSSCASPCISPPLRYNRYTVKIPKDVISIARRYDKQGAKRRILSVCVRLFIEKGYARTTTAEILKLADVANGSFYNIFDSKDAILKELAAFMFDNQFDTAYRNLNGSGEEDPILLYAVETSLQITLTELNENLREIYVEAYTQPRVAEYIHHRTTEEICRIFRSCLPQATEQDFYELEIGAEGIMRSYMAHPCSGEFTLQKKLSCFLTMLLGAYRVPADRQEAILAHVQSIDMVALANTLMQSLFTALAMKYEFVLTPEMLPKG